MKVSRTFDKELVTKIITSDELWCTVAEDGFEKSDYEPDVDNECWLLMEVDNEVAALYNIHARNSVTAEIHAHVVPKHRKQYSKETGYHALRWIYENAPTYHKVVAQIPVIYENVRQFTIGFGFQDEGINRQSYLKDYQIVDQWMLGITRDEIGETL